LLCNDCEIGGYTRAVSERRLSKHVPAAKNRRATIEALLKTGCFYEVLYEELVLKITGVDSSVRQSVKTGLDHVKLKNLHCLTPLPGNVW
jgi:hypothetical protein